VYRNHIARIVVLYERRQAFSPHERRRLFIVFGFVVRHFFSTPIVLFTLPPCGPED